jgi:hypothetical protein
MRDHGWDVYKAFWIIGGISISFPVVMLIPDVVPFIIGLILLWFGYKKYSSYRRLDKWEKSQGKLLNTDIGIYRVSDGQYSPATPFYFPMAHYCYTYKGSTYENNVYAYDKRSIWTTELSSVKKTIATLSNDEGLLVYVNPVNPNESSLNIGISSKRYSQAYSLLVSGLIIVILGIFLWTTNNYQ